MLKKWIKGIIGENPLENILKIKKTKKTINIKYFIFFNLSGSM